MVARGHDAEAVSGEGKSSEQDSKEQAGTVGGYLDIDEDDDEFGGYRLKLPVSDISQQVSDIDWLITERCGVDPDDGDEGIEVAVNCLLSPLYENLQKLHGDERKSVQQGVLVK